MAFFRWLFIPKSPFHIAYQYLYLYQILDLNTRYLAANYVRGWGIFGSGPHQIPELGKKRDFACNYFLFVKKITGFEPVCDFLSMDLSFGNGVIRRILAKTGIFLVSPENLTNRMLHQPTRNKEASQANQSAQYSSPDHIHHGHQQWPILDGRQIGEIVSGVGDQAE